MPTFDTPEPISATIDLGLGDVRITAGDRATTVVDVRPSDPSNDGDTRAANATRIDFANGRLLIKAPKLRSWLPRSDGGSIDVTVELPAGSSLNGSAASADFRCDGPLGTCRIKIGLGTIEVEQADTAHLKSGAGDITVDHVTGAAELTAGAGEVRVRELDDGAVIKNSNGDTWVGVAGGDVRLNSANGSIAVDVANAGVVAKTANGDVRLSEVVRGSVALETSLGDLEVGIRDGTAAWLDVSARAGKVHNALDAAGAPGTSAETVEVRARTSVGNVVIRRP
jgi:Putative adhesin